MQPQRRKRIKKLINQLNKERKVQKQKTDILCNDLLSAQKKIINQLQEYNFTLDFCQAIAGHIGLTRLMSETESIINSYFSNCGVGIFLIESNGFEFHLSADDEGIDFNISKIEGCFNHELVNKICHSNSVFSLDDMFAMSFNPDMSFLNKLSVYSIPLGGFSPSVGFILVWRSAENPITENEIHRLRSIAPVLARSIHGCQLLNKKKNKAVES